MIGWWSQRTSNDHGSGDGGGRAACGHEINVHAVDDGLEVEGDLDVEDLYTAKLST